MSRPKKSVPIKLGDLGVLHLRMDFNALATIESMTGKNLLQEDAWTTLSASDMRVIIWAMLSWEPGAPSLEEVGAEIDLDNLEYISECLGKVVETQSETEVKTDEEEANPPQTETEPEAEVLTS